jgi:hypothetical protein
VSHLAEELRVHGGIDDGKVEPERARPRPSVESIEDGVIDYEVAILDFGPDKMEIRGLRCEDDDAAMVAARAILERIEIHELALGQWNSPGMRFAGMAAEGSLSTRAPKPGCVCIFPTHDTVVLLERCLDSPEVKLVELFIFLDGGVRNVDL